MKYVTPMIQRIKKLKLRWQIGLGLLVLALVVVLFTNGDSETHFYTRATVHRGDVPMILREMATLMPSDPVLYKCKFNAPLQWIIEDGMWVDKGDKLYVVDDEKILEQANTTRTRLLNDRQLLKLALLKQGYVVDTEKRKLDAAVRAYELEKIRFRIGTDRPKGGRALTRVHNELLPLEAETRKVRNEYEQVQAGFQAAQDAFLDALGAVQENRDRILRVQTVLDEYAIEMKKDAKKLKEDERKKHDDAKVDLPVKQKDKERLATERVQLSGALAKRRVRRDEMKVPRDRVAEKLAAREAKEQELYIRIEIEKRGVPKALLELSGQAAKLTVDEARRKAEAGGAALAVGAMSKAAVDALESTLKKELTKLRIIEQKITIEARPPPEEELTEYKMKLEQAKAKAEQAHEVFDLVIKKLETEILQLEAQVRRQEYWLDKQASGFASILESGIEFSQKELEMIDTDDTAQRKVIEARIAKQKAHLEAARNNPPHIAFAPISGVAELKQRNGRPINVGDTIYEDDAVIMIYPPENMEVIASINEVNVTRIKKGMAAVVTIPALQNLQVGAEIYQVAGVGNDKFKHLSNRNNPSFANVTQFAMRARLHEKNSKFLQGMPVTMEIEVGRRANVLWLPLGAVTHENGSTFVFKGNGRWSRKKEIEGERYGSDTFIVTKGLEEGDTVSILRIKIHE